MYVDVKIGKRGEIVIPSFLRKRFGISYGQKVRLLGEGNKVELVFKSEDVVSDFERMAKTARIKKKDLIYGDKLYEEVFA